MDIKKIGIITFHRSHNYGAVLQAYALLTTLEKMGHKVEIIDYWPKYREGDYSLFNFQSKSNNGKVTWASTIKTFIKRVLTFPNRWKMYSRFNSFIKHRLKVRNTSNHLGSDIPDKYDVIICGSDQIWRYNSGRIAGFDDVYFAKYPLNKKVVKLSYGSSMGDMDLDEDAKKIFSKLIENLYFG